MNEQFVKEAKRVNEVALFFATEGYHTSTSFFKDCHSMNVSVFYHDIDKTNKIRHLMNSYANVADKVEFADLSYDAKRPLYTLTLSKYIS